MKDGEPFVATPEQMAHIVGGEDPEKVMAPAATNTAPLTAIERATLHGLIAARTAVFNEIEGYLTNVVCGRLGVHRTRVTDADIKTGLITLASDAPQVEVSGDKN